MNGFMHAAALAGRTRRRRLVSGGRASMRGSSGMFRPVRRIGHVWLETLAALGWMYRVSPEGETVVRWLIEPREGAGTATARPARRSVSCRSGAGRAADLTLAAAVGTGELLADKFQPGPMTGMRLSAASYVRWVSIAERPKKRSPRWKKPRASAGRAGAVDPDLEATAGNRLSGSAAARLRRQADCGPHCR